MRRAVLPLLLALVAAGCGGGDDADRASAPAARATAEADPCEAVRPDTRVRGPERLNAPPETEFAAITRREGQTFQADGFLALTPAAFIAYIEGRDDLHVLFKEFEGPDAEVQYSDARTRAFWKVVQTCPGGSTFTALYARELVPRAIRRRLARGS